MTTKDFVTIAAILREMPDGERVHAALHFAKYLAVRNIKFDRDRFFKACLKPEEIAALEGVS